MSTPITIRLGDSELELFNSLVKAYQGDVTRHAIARECFLMGLATYLQRIYPKKVD